MKRLVLISYGETSKNVAVILSDRLDPEGLNKIGVNKIKNTFHRIKEFNLPIALLSFVAELREKNIGFRLPQDLKENIAETNKTGYIEYFLC